MIKYNNFDTINIEINNININRANAGFVNTNCDFVKTMFSSICIHCLNNLFIFNNEQINNLNNIINRIKYDS